MLIISWGMSLKIAIVGIVGVPASYGGLETLIENLLDNEDHEFTVYCSSLHYASKVNTYKNSRLVYIPIPANGIFGVLYDFVSLIHSVFTGHKKILVLGVSSAPLFRFLKFVSPSLQIMVNIDGLEWRREKWGVLAKLYLRFATWLAIKHSDKVIADNDAVSEFVRSRYGAQTEMIAYGGDHALVGTEKVDILLDISPLKRYSLSVCRIEPENNIGLILEAFKQSGENIIFIGNWGSSDYGKSLFDFYSQCVNVTLLHPIYCADSLYTYRNNCALYVHGHSVGGTNPSLVEIMHFGCPIIAFDCVFNRSTLENHGGYFLSVEGLLSQIDKYLTSNDSGVFREIASKRYTWDKIRDQYFSLFGS